MAEILLAGAPWGAAGRGAAAKSHREDAAGRGAVAEILLPGRAIGKKMLAEGGEHRGRAAGRQPQEGITIKKESDP